MNRANMGYKDYRPCTYLSENTKTGASINLPIKGHCLPTKRCAQDCYAKSGHTILESNIKKQKFISRYLLGKDITELVYECKGLTAVRLNGTGDLLPGHIPAILSLAQQCPKTSFWGMTRKVNIARVINGLLPNLSLLVSVDSTSPKSVWKYEGLLCFGPRRPEDKVPDNDHIITIFPYHHAGRIIGNVPEDPKDCLAIRKTVKGCLDCKRCWSWNT